MKKGADIFMTWYIVAKRTNKPKDDVGNFYQRPCTFKLFSFFHFLSNFFSVKAKFVLVLGNFLFLTNKRFFKNNDKFVSNTFTGIYIM